MLNEAQEETSSNEIYLFRTITIEKKRLPNRIVMAPLISGYAARDGHIHNELYDYYVERVHGGVGLIITEPMQVVPPTPEQAGAHIGLYSDDFIPTLRHLVKSIHGGGARVIVTLDAPDYLARGSVKTLTILTVLFIQAAERALQAGCDGVMLSMADGGVLSHLISPLQNKRHDAYGDTLGGRLRLPLDIINGIRMNLGKRIILGFRLVADEFVAGGIRLPDSHIIARHLCAVGVNLLDVTTDTYTDAQVAQFPGWRIPLAHSLKHAVPDVPIIGSGLLSNPYLAESFVRDGSVDMVMLERTLVVNPYWPQLAHIMLLANSKDGDPYAQALWGWRYNV